MTTSRSPLKRLRRDATHIAALLKSVERGEPNAADVGGKIAEARKHESVIFGVAMDDKFLKIEMTWATIRDTSEAGITEFIVKKMRGDESKPQ